jgi:citrate lyase alpha subunit
VTEPAVAAVIRPALELLHLSAHQIHNIAFIIAMAISTSLHVVVGEVAPKNWAILKPDWLLPIVALPLVRKNVPVVRKAVYTVVTPGETVDVVVTDQGVAVNPRRKDLLANLQAAGLPLMPIEDLQRRAYEITGEPEPAPAGGKVVGLVEYRDGTIIDVIRELG